MAIVLSNSVPTPTLPSSSSPTSYACPLQIKDCNVREKRSANTSIRSSSETSGEPTPARLDRRNVLLGLGGFYGATALAGNPSAVGAPIEPPELTSCRSANYPDGYGDQVPVQCCPPYDFSKPINVQPYQFPVNPPLRRRKPAHLLSQFEKDRFKSVIAQMKALPRSHPWNYLQQAQIHCAYCNEAYNQKGTNTPLQVHFSWLFFPWHRYYLYFLERIIGKIINDDTFALPYWNFDVPAGMKIPDIYLDPSSSLYNPNRNSSHFNDSVNLNYSYDIEDQPPPADVVQKNLEYLDTMFKTTLAVPRLFMGTPARAGDTPTDRKSKQTMGYCESMHNVVHAWVGNVEAPNTDMGNFFSAARDPIFFGHHANIDRMWDIYRNKRGNLLEFNDPDWLDATFIFYDENEKVVSVKVRDCLNVNDLGYGFADNNFSVPTVQPRAAPITNPKLISDFGPSPRPLNETIRAVVTRPKASRTPAEKAAFAEVLFIDDIDILDPEPIRFDVYVDNLLQNTYTVGPGTFSGSFTRLRHNNHIMKDGPTVKAGLQLGIQSILENIGADAAQKIAVNIVPRNGKVKIGGVYIELVPAQAY
ncbi:polyphenol oxidase, chloroplastic-like [Aristolochia californica]|uniref:polyphenol oxidase, chloroplastic-like n=1 Tax=Aristolochia californica TaxID=171875 RepID=UPI0035DB36D5